MRRKTMKTVLTFASTADAMHMESTAAETSIPGRIIPVPSQISAGCGLAWCAETSQRQELLDALRAHSLAFEGVFEVEMY